jgi:hypothetical protein
MVGFMSLTLSRQIFEPGQVSEPLVQPKMAHDLSSSAVDEGMGSHPPLLPSSTLYLVSSRCPLYAILLLEAGSV